MWRTNAMFFVESDKPRTQGKAGIALQYTYFLYEFENWRRSLVIAVLGNEQNLKRGRNVSKKKGYLPLPHYVTLIPTRHVFSEVVIRLEVC